MAIIGLTAAVVGCLPVATATASTRVTSASETTTQSAKSASVWVPPAAVNHTRVGQVPTAAWSPTSVQSGGKGSTSSSPGALTAAAGSLGASPMVAGAGAAGSGLGAQAFYGLETFGLNAIDKLQAQVNLANGNLVVHATDLAINAPGLSVRLDRFYNSRAAGTGAFGVNSVLSTGRDVGLQVGGSSVTFVGPSGFTAVFAGTTTFTPPAGINADLVKNGDGTYTLTYRKSGEKLSFTSGGYLTADKDRNGVGLSFLYSNDQLASITDAAGRVTTFSYAGGQLAHWTDPAGRQEAYDYDTAGHLTRTTDAAGNQTTYTYNASGQLTNIATFAGTSTTIGYDTSNRVTTIKRDLVRGNPAAGSTTTTFGYPSSISTTETDNAGHTSTYTLDSAGRVTAVKNALGKTKSTTWTANSDIQSAVDALGSTPSAGNATKYTYDSSNNLTAVAIPTGAAAQAQYANSTTAGTTCTSSDTTHPYLAKCEEDGQGNQSSLTYTGVGNVSSIKDTSSSGSTGITRTFKYQGDAGVPSCGGFTGQTCSVTTGNGNTTTYAYNATGQLTSSTPPAPGIATTYGYDSLSRLTSVGTPNGITVTYSYDNRDEHTQTVYSVGGLVSYFFDGDGELSSMADSVGGNQSYTYDGLNRQTSITPPGAAGAVTVTYNTAGDLATYTDTAGTVTYGYDAGHELTSLAQPGGSCTGTITGCTTFGYNGNGARTTTTYPGAATQTVTLDISGRPVEIKAVNGSTVLSDLAYSYTKAAKDTTAVQTRTDKLGIGGPINSVTTYGYDTQDRLTTAVEKTSAGAANASWSYTYDKDGNRTSNTAVIAGVTTTTSQSYNALDELTSLNGSAAGLSYDADGNQTANPGNTAVGVAPVTATTIDGRDQITAATVAGAATTNSYLGETQTTRRSASNGTATTNYQATMLGLTSQATTGNTTTYTRTPDGTLIAATTAGVSNYYLSDNLGSTVGLVSSTGAKAAAYAYDPYGRTRTSTGTAAATNLIRYVGGQYDPAAGTTKFGARYYDPNIGRFTQHDPSGQEANNYAYAGDNPVTKTDPNGLCDGDPWYDIMDLCSDNDGLGDGNSGSPYSGKGMASCAAGGGDMYYGGSSLLSAIGAGAEEGSAFGPWGSAAGALAIGTLWTLGSC